MAEITNVDLLFQRRVRGIAALSRWALQNDGNMIASVPDEMESRTSHIVRFDARGRSQIVETYSVETLRRTEIAQDGTSYLGTTDDDLYLFRTGRKSRFLPDRRASYTDAALGESGERFAAAFCDMLQSGHALALGDNSGRVLWTKDMAFAVSRVATDRAASFVATAGEVGNLVLWDSTRRSVLRYLHESRILAVATLGPEKTVFAARDGVGAVDARGERIWFTELLGEPLEVAMDSDGRTVAVLLRLDDTSGRLVLLGENGLPLWDVDYEESRPTGLSLSGNGRFTGVTLRDGTLAVYELFYGERLAAADPDRALMEAQTARDNGDYVTAVSVLRARLEAVPSDIRAGQALRETQNEQKTRVFAASETAQAVGDWQAADTRLADLLTIFPQDSETVTRRHELRAFWAQAAQDRGEEALQTGDDTSAEAHFLESIYANPLNEAARDGLARARSAGAQAALARGRELLASGTDFAGAKQSFILAQTRGASGMEVTALLRDARIREALALGNTLYQDRQYAAALFQFKKALRLDPDNADAQQKIRYAHQFLADTQLNDRFSRLE